MESLYSYSDWLKDQETDFEELYNIREDYEIQRAEEERIARSIRE